MSDPSLFEAAQVHRHDSRNGGQAMANRLSRTLAGALLIGIIAGLSACALPEEEASSGNNNGAAQEKKDKEADNSGDEYTVAQENAIEAAEGYLDFSGFSREGLIDQLSSKAGDGYSVKDATVAVDSLDVDWNAEAVESAESYLEFTSFSRAGLIDQLTSPAGDQFTKSQATYAANKVGL